jgi:hypothetical protein
MSEQLHSRLAHYLEDPAFAETVTKLLAVFESQDKKRSEETQEQRVRGLAASCGYRLMHRRKNKDLYWVVYEYPMSLDEVEQWCGIAERMT